MTAIKTPTTIRTATLSAAALTTATAAGLAAGAGTAELQGVVPESFNTVANSGAVWSVVALMVAAAAARSRATAVGAGLLALVGEVAGYYIWVSRVRHLPVLPSEELLWTVAALWIGPIIGLAAFAVRWGPRHHRAWALAAVAGVVAGEGWYLIRFAGVPVSGWVELGVAAVLGGTAVSSTRARLTTIGTGALAAVLVYSAYRLLAFG
jgi:hypothetical protein